MWEAVVDTARGRIMRARSLAAIHQAATDLRVYTGRFDVPIDFP